MHALVTGSVIAARFVVFDRWAVGGWLGNGEKGVAMHNFIMLTEQRLWANRRRRLQG